VEAPFAGSRMTGEGVLVIDAQRFRSQDRNRADARERLVELIRAGTHVPKPRRATKPGKAAKERRQGQKAAEGAAPISISRYPGDSLEASVPGGTRR
jgi:protein subunit release factor B